MDPAFRDPSPFLLLPRLEKVPVESRSLTRLRDLLGSEVFDRSYTDLKNMAAQLGSRKVLHVNSTAKGGGVAEILAFLVPYFADIGVHVTWLVLKGDDEFFKITKRIHNGLHGFPGDGGNLSLAEAHHYEKVCKFNAFQIGPLLKPNDIVICHDPQTAGLIPILKRYHAVCIWRCHIGSEQLSNHCVTRSWKFLRPYVLQADHCCFTRADYVPPFFDKKKVSVLLPSISAFSPKNQPMDPEVALCIIQHLGVVGFRHQSPTCDCLEFRRLDGSRGLIRRFADIMHAGPLPFLTDPMILQVSRWDRLKDMVGVMSAFVDFVLPEHPQAFLLLVGPNVHGVSDDPEEGLAYDECLSRWRALPHMARSRVQIVCLPVRDVQENAAMVNALQTHATVITQKSLQEGFGLTVTEALWKKKPVVASAVGGIKDQIESGKQGLLIRNPHDLEQFGRSINQILSDESLGTSLAAQGHEKVQQCFLALRHVRDYMDLFLRVGQQDGEVDQ